MTKERLHGIASGDVQGVFFRAHIREKAKDHGLVGWVKNKEDKTVEFVAEGEKETLELFLKDCEKGSPAASIDHIKTTWEKGTGEFDQFEIIF